MLGNKADSYYAKNADSHSFGNRLFGFFGWLGYENQLAADVRIYRQDKICDRYTRSKEGTFSSNGLFAHFARGPMGLFSAASAAVSVIFTGVVYAFVCLKALAGAFGLGAVTQYVASITKVSGGMSALVSALGFMRNNTPFLALTFEYLDIPNTMYQGSLTVEKRRDRNYQVEFRNVSFKYPGSENYALRNVNMKFEIGKRLAVVGMNGSGKTTFIKLLCRLYDPTEGEILLNGIDIRKYNYREYMDIFSVVFQDFELLALKLGENVAGHTNYDKALVTDCLTKAGFADRLAELKNGTETYLYKVYDSKNGVDISGGEAQKIAIARALYKDAPFIILDEPTAALDPIAEAEIYAKFDEIAGDKTAIYISHRLSSCRFCDEIAVFHEGAVIQQGTHASLVADESGKYYELWHAQAQYYTE
jgi:ATP-binding cassette subfamily B protein